MLVSGGQEKSGGLSVDKVLLLFRLSIRGNNNCQEYGILHYMYV